MAPRGDGRLFLSILFIACYCTVTLAQVPVDCCLSVAKKPIGKGFVANYHHQVQGQGCAIDATIFLSRGGRTMCAPVNEKWVEGLKRHVDQLRKFCKKQNYTGKRCTGVKP
ncbi:C-C motif chemokine 19-like [Astatotilapia calliptera]|uniref:Chemokine interleukin-8-like domain-containing protein n=1 Tax=Astatotilapia calliptera TaxID=8154 RepID=A0AAX7TNJ2_ASTCA|nr:C-C motif chemokine 19-like [Astatotilapia calliptera]